MYSKRWLNQQKAVKEPLRRRETESQIKERAATESKSNLQLKRKLDDSIVVIEELDNEIKLLTMSMRLNKQYGFDGTTVYGNVITKMFNDRNDDNTVKK